MHAHGKWLRKETEKSETKYATSAYRPIISKNVLEVFTKAAPTTLSKIALPSDMAVVKEDVFMPQHWAMSNTYLNVGMLAYGVGEMRYLIDGSYMMAGVKLDCIEGDTMQKKIEGVLSQAGMRAFMRDTEDETKGFWTIHDTPHSVVMVPRGMVIVTSGLHAGSDKEDNQGAVGIRWGWMNVAEAEAVNEDVKNMLQVYPGLKDGPHAHWQKALETFIIAVR